MRSQKTDAPPPPPDSRPPIPLSGVWDDFARARFDVSLRATLTRLAIPFDDTLILRGARHADAIVAANEHVNLTRIVEPDAMAILHYADSLTVLRALNDTPSGARLLDLGTGAGFPGIPLKLARPDLRVTLMDSLRKRLDILEKIAPLLDLNDLTFVHARAEDAAKDRRHAGQYDVVVARAVASLPRLLAWCAPLTAPGGRVIAMKSGDCDTEQADAEAVVDVLRLRFVQSHTEILPAAETVESASRTLLVYEKSPRRPNRV